MNDNQRAGSGAAFILFLAFIFFIGLIGNCNKHVTQKELREQEKLDSYEGRWR